MFHGAQGVLQWQEKAFDTMRHSPRTCRKNYPEAKINGGVVETGREGVPLFVSLGSSQPISSHPASMPPGTGSAFLLPGVGSSLCKTNTLNHSQTCQGHRKTPGSHHLYSCRWIWARYSHPRRPIDNSAIFPRGGPHHSNQGIPVTQHSR